MFLFYTMIETLLLRICSRNCLYVVQATFKENASQYSRQMNICKFLLTYRLQTSTWYLTANEGDEDYMWIMA